MGLCPWISSDRERWPPASSANAADPRGYAAEIAPMLMPFECDWLAVIKTVREQQPDYLVGKSKNVRLPVDGESRLCATLVLSVEKLSWLPKGAWNILLELTALIAQKTE